MAHRYLIVIKDANKMVHHQSFGVTVLVMPTETQPSAATRTYSLAEIAQILCGSAGTAEQYWVAQRLRGNASPRLSGYKVQRRWRMTQDDLDAAIELLRPARTDIPVIPAMTSMTSRSQRRLVS